MALSKEKQQKLHEARRTQILDAAIRLFDTRGYTNTKIADISEAAGISKGLIYRYFKSKKDILYSLIDNLNHCIEECAAKPSSREGIRLFSLRLLSYPYYEDYVPPFRVLFTAMIHDNTIANIPNFPVDENFGRSYFGKLFRKGQENGEFRKGDPELFGDIYWKYLLGCIAIMSPEKEGKTYLPDIDKVLTLFE